MELWAGRRRYFVPLCRLAWFAILEQLLMTAVNYVDTAMVGALGYRATAAVAINISIVWLVNGLSMGIASGYSVQVAHAVGAGDHEQVRRLIRQAILAVVVLGAGLCAAGLALYRHIPRWLGAAPEILGDARAYLGVYMASLPLVIATAVFSSIHRCMGNTRLPLLVNVAANAINVALNFLLIYPPRTVGGLALPGAGWGVMGAAVATAIAAVFSGAVLAATFFLRDDGYRVSPRESYRPDRAVIKQAARLGLPLAAERIVMNSGQLVMTRLVATLGSASLAANQVAVTAEALCYLPAHGVAHAGTALVGQSIGGQRRQDALGFGKVAVLVGFVLAGICAGILVLIADPLCGLFTASAEVAALAARMLRIVAISEPFLCAYIVSSGVLRGAGNARYPLLVGLIGMWAVRIPLSPILVLVLHMDLDGIWIAMVLDQFVKGGLCIAVLCRDRWLPQRGTV